MAGYCVFMDRDEVEVHKRAKKEREQYPAILAANLVNKGFIIWLLLKFCLRDIAGSPERARWLHLARSGSQSQRAIWFILPSRGASHIINIEYFMESARVRCLHTSCVGLMHLLTRGELMWRIRNREQVSEANE